MDTHETEHALRREAIRRHLQGEARQQICADLGRSLRWFDKWWHTYASDPQTDLAEQSRALHTSPQALPPHVIAPVVAVRERLEAAQTPETRYGLIGAASIQTRSTTNANSALFFGCDPGPPQLARLLVGRSS